MITDPTQLALAAASGGLVSLLLTVFGGGGSVLAVPLLLYVVGVRDPHVAIGASAAGVALNALTGLVGHAKDGRVRWPCALTFAGFGVVGALAGSSLALRIDGESLLIFFAGAMALVGAAMLRPARSLGDPDARLSLRGVPVLAASGVGVGAASGFFGIGGGFLIVPGLTAATGMTLALAQASSLVSVAAFGTTTALNYAVAGRIDWAIVAAMTVGGVAGAAAGRPLARRLATRAPLARRLFAGLILIVAVYVAARATGVV
ncbi:MAG: sulfite exporter TauE/SafE family protein [Caulobacteraceae bacterium]|nr:sulfite exporter TauE/SafE family protein [Caulobacteraceae bacterium]